jgi:hypothetical protein
MIPVYRATCVYELSAVYRNGRGLAMNVDNEFRKHAGRCRLQAESAIKMADRAFWLLLAENWQKLAEEFEDPPKRELGDALTSAFRLQ